MQTTHASTLWVVATPIGNLEDLSPRAVTILRQVDAIAAEDTRHSAALLAHHGIDTRMLALHEHNERRVHADLVERLLGGESLALISDAGTPLISDPGYRLVRAARGAGVNVAVVPGPCAAIAALSIAGLASDRFVFEGFPPAKAAARRARLRELAGESRTLVFYESSHRILASVQDMAQAFGAERAAVIARELTKLHETVLSGTLAELAERLHADRDQQRGEFVVLVAGAEQTADERVTDGRRVFALLREQLPPAKAARLAAAITGAPRKLLYLPGDPGQRTEGRSSGQSTQDSNP